ncbi:MAG TPA: spore coat protein [Spirochaetaceae bacterium]|jgi:sialic acid synthase SpsE|nr:spore coat protein [Spirochaetaceae bacterium]
MREYGFSIGRERFDSHRPLIIAELGTGHGGSAAKAGELIHAAVEAGADCVKFQHVYADEIIHPNTGLVPLPGGPIPLYKRFQELETSPDFLASIKAEVERRGAIFLCTPFGLRSAQELRALGVSAMKLASPELNHLPLLAELASYGLPTLLSSGVSTLADIEAAILAFRRGHPERYGSGSEALALLHCVTAYPAPEEDYGLRVLKPLSTLFGLAVGVSDHSMDPVLVPALATAVGSCAIEKHFCLSRGDPGLDDPIALEPAAFARMCQALRSIAAMDPALAIEELSREFGVHRVQAVLGSGEKRLAPSEEANYGRTNRSLHALRYIKAGETLSQGMLALLRTEKVLRPGLAPAFMALAIGRRAARDIPSGEGVEWDDLA